MHWRPKRLLIWSMPCVVLDGTTTSMFSWQLKVISNINKLAIMDSLASLSSRNGLAATLRVDLGKELLATRQGCHLPSFL